MTASVLQSHILAADQNIYLGCSYIIIMGLKYTLSFNVMVFSSKLEERLNNYSSLICVTELEGTISNWTIDLKAVSWTVVGYSFINYTSIKQTKDLELILSVSFAVNHIMQSKELSIQEKQSIVRLQEQNRSIRERERERGTLGDAKSTD